MTSTASSTPYHSKPPCQATLSYTRPALMRQGCSAWLCQIRARGDVNPQPQTLQTASATVLTCRPTTQRSGISAAVHAQTKPQLASGKTSQQRLDATRVAGVHSHIRNPCMQRCCSCCCYCLTARTCQTPLHCPCLLLLPHPSLVLLAAQQLHPALTSSTHTCHE